MTGSSDTPLVQVVSLGGVLTLRQPGDESPEIVWDDVFFYYGPDGQVPNGQPFATVVTKDYPAEPPWRLDRPGAFRLNIAVGKDALQAIIGDGSARSAGRRFGLVGRVFGIVAAIVFFVGSFPWLAPSWWDSLVAVGVSVWGSLWRWLGTLNQAAAVGSDSLPKLSISRAPRKGSYSPCLTNCVTEHRDFTGPQRTSQDAF